MTLTITRGLVATGSLAALIALGTAGQVGTAGQAHADPPLLNGTYDIDGGDEDAYWTATSTCATACASRRRRRGRTAFSGPRVGIGQRPWETRICRRTTALRAAHSAAVAGGVNGK